MPSGQNTHSAWRSTSAPRSGRHAIPAMAHRTFHLVPGRGAATGVARLPVAPQVGFDVVPLAAAVLVVAGHLRAVAVGRRKILVLAARSAKITLPVLAI